MPSYQQIEVDLEQIKRKVDFIMKAIKMGRQSPLVGMPPTLVSMLDLYNEAQAAGLTIAEPEKETPNAGE